MFAPDLLFLFLLRLGLGIVRFYFVNAGIYSFDLGDSMFRKGVDTASVEPDDKDGVG
jgi:hypothetical protein